ncbi:AAA family ATPase [Paenibacillus sp. Soil724D2]|uniref:AAA family ATPase n=1 Tax=Paenibacillus sp. (strain Soil724D2) TaxID=1736392 RepID=UPI000713C73A|nr:AAA family ATPase [Paenibacillus sp. Soil724D2]KRE50636.1 hypothetical protein ASG85_20500 [Paenibacillus sp. Soil724D2]
MISIKRIPEPNIFYSQEFIVEKDLMHNFFQEETLEQFKPNYKLYKIIAKQLAKAFHNKCAFCELKLDNPSVWHVERFRPSINAMNLKGQISSTHYWWLRYDWNNLYLICKECNINKGNLFPVKGKRAQRFQPLESEVRLLLDPCVDNPEEFLLCDYNSGLLFSDTDIGRITIDVFNLNRKTLKDKRKQEIDNLIKLWNSLTKNTRLKRNQHLSNEDILFYQKVEEYLLSIFNNDKDEFLLIKRLFILTKLSENPEVLLTFNYGIKWQEIINKRKSISHESIKKKLNTYVDYVLKTEDYDLLKKTKLENYFTKRLIIQKIEICNFKNIGNLIINFPNQNDENAPWLMILGENSTGKTSILKAIALTLMGSINRARLGLDAKKYLKKGTKRGFVKLYLNNRKAPIELFFDETSSLFKGNIEEPPVLLLGYGSTRLFTEEDEDISYSGDLARCENLFNPRVPLINSEKFLLSLKNERFKDAVAAIKRLFTLTDTYRIYKRKKSNQEAIYTTMFGSGVPLNEMSDGYRTITALACDIMMILQKIWKDSTYAQGIVLIDEIDSHLHPRWKMQIVQRLRSVFPRLQFIVTSHEPLTLRGLKEDEIMVLRRNIKGNIYSLADLPYPEGLRVDQLLTSDYFGLNNTIDPEIEIVFNRYYQLLSKDHLSENEKTELEGNRELLNNLKLLGENQREQLVFEAIDKFISKNKEIIKEGEAENLKQETLSRIVQIWEEI